MVAAAQDSVSVSGFVKDSTGKPVVAASIVIVTPSGAGIHFTKTGPKGYFACTFLQKQDSCSIKVTMLGYRPFIHPVTTSTRSPLSIILKAAETRLQEVTVKSKTSIQSTGDTLQYNVSAFKEKNDRVIADLIQRLPGIQMDDKGIISYNGKQISNVYIDGDNLLGGRYRIATNNVPVDAVEQVQVIERDQPVKALRGYVNADKVSLNLKLADKARTVAINTGHIAAGDKAYSAELNNLLFRKQVKSINSFKANNTGASLQHENADAGAPSDGSETSVPQPQPYLSMSGESLPSVDERYYLRNNDFAGNINALFKLASDWGLRLNAASVQLKRKYNYTNAVNFFLPGADTVRYEEWQNSITRENHWQFQVQAEKNSKAAYIKSSTRLDLPKFRAQGSTAQNGVSFLQAQPASHFTASNETGIVKALGSRNLLQYNSVLQYFSVNESLNIMPGLHADIVNDGKDFLSLEQRVETKSTYIHQSATFKSKIGRLVLSATAGAEYEQNRLQSNLYKTDSSHVITSAGGRFQNDLLFDDRRLFAKASMMYELKKGLVSAEVSPSFHSIRYDSPEKMPQQDQHYFVLNPVVEFRKNIGRYGELQFRFAQRTDFGQINDIYPGTILVNYRQFSFNETPLPQTGITSFGLRWSYRKPIRMFFYNFGISADRTKQNFIHSYIVQSGITRVMAIDLDNRLNKYSFNGSISKYLFFISTNLSASGNANLQKGNAYYNGGITPFTSYIYSLSATARKKLFSKAAISVTGDMARYIHQQKGVSPDNITKTGKIRSEWRHNLTETMSYVLSHQFTTYRQSAQSAVRNHFLDASVKYAPLRWKSYFEVQCVNLINQHSYRQISSGPNQLSLLDLPLRERMVLLKYSFGF
jgi:hypothetical protein